MNLSIVIPCYNEGRQIEKTWRILRECLRHYPDDLFEIVFVNDGSTDDTLKQIYKVRDEFYNKTKSNVSVKVRSTKQNYGKGMAVRIGLVSSLFKTIAVLDADLSVPPSCLMERKFLFAGEAKRPLLVIGRRNQVVQQPLYRKAAGGAFRLLCKGVTGLNYHDTQCPFKVFVGFPRRFYQELNVDGFCYDVEVIYKAKKAGACIIEAEVEYYNDPNSKVTLRKTITMFFDLLRIRVKG